MKRILIFCLAVFIISCQQQSITKIDFESRDYEFNAEISRTLEQTGEAGFSARRFSFASEHQKLLKSLQTVDSIKNPLSDSLWTQIQRDYQQIDAKQYILEKAKEMDIVMFNEDHNLPKHRNFVASMLPELYELGYRYLALEALGMLGNGTMYDKELQQRGYPMIHTGLYTKEPEFSMLIRKALELGFLIIGYDEGSAYGFQGGEREARGAENILSQYDHTQGKLIVHCGWDHIKKGEAGTYWQYALAERLKQKTRKEIFTVNQTAHNERFNIKYEEPLMQRIKNDKSIVLINKNGKSIDLSKNKEWYDVFVFHARSKYDHDIPDWIRSEGKIKTIDLTKIELAFPCKVFVFDHMDDATIANPIYVSEIASKESTLNIPTRGKKVKLVITNKRESLLLEWK